MNFANVRLHPINELERVRYRKAIWDCYCERSREHRCQRSCAASNRCLFDDKNKLGRQCQGRRDLEQ